MSEFLSVMDLPAPGKRAVFLGFLWRSVIIAVLGAIGGAIIGGVVGAILGFIGAALGVDMPRMLFGIRIIAFLIGVALGAAYLWIYIRWLFGAKFGGYRLCLMKIEDAESP